MAVKILTNHDGLDVQIHPPVRRLALFSAAGLLTMLIAVGVYPALTGLQTAILTGKNFGGYLVAMLAAALITLAVFYSMLKTFFSTERLLLTATEIELQSRLFGRVTGRLAAPNSSVEKLCVEESWAGERKTPVECLIRLECAGQSITFAASATHEEAFAILDAMRKIYDFPAVDEKEVDPPSEEE